MAAPLPDVLMASAAANNAAMMGIVAGIADLRAAVNANTELIVGHRALAVAEHAATMAALAANQAAMAANQAANQAAMVAVMELIAANQATSVANRALAVAEHAAVMAAIGHAGNFGRSFGFQAHIKVVRAVNSCDRDLQSSIVPMPLAPADPLVPGVFDLCPPEWPAEGYNMNDFHRLTHEEANEVIDMYALDVHGDLLPDKKNAILAHFGLPPVA